MARDHLATAQTIQFLTGSYIVIAFHRDDAGVYLAILLDEYKGNFVVCTFHLDDLEWSNGNYTEDVFTAVERFNERVKR
jgi:hypothetical protein